MKNVNKCIIATRTSKLAMAQTKIVKTLLENLGVQVEIKKVSTKGDKDRTSPLSAIGGNGLFVAEIEKVLLSHDADIAVHSGKDLPYRLADGLVVAATPKAASCNDCLLTVSGRALPENPIIGTGSARRANQCKNLLPNARFSQIRGNIDTRIKKLCEGAYDGIILAKAGLERLNIDLSVLTVKEFNADEFIPAACQGIIAVECRADDEAVQYLLAKINHKETMKRFEAERYMLSCLQADCSAAVGVHAMLDGDEIFIEALFKDKKASMKGQYDKYKALCAEIKEEIYG